MKITQISQGKWQLDFTLNKKRIRRTITGSKKMAEQAAILEKERIYRARYEIQGPRKRIRFKDYAKIYKENFVRGRRSADNTGSIINTLNRYFGDKFLDEITPGDIQRFIQERKNSKKPPVGNATINRNLTVLQTIFNKAIDSEDYGIERNPVKKVDRLKENSHRERILTLEEMNGLLETAAASRGWCLPLFLVIALNTGMRKSEILSLEWEHVDFKDKQIKVTRERSKSGKARLVPMNSNVEEELMKLDMKHEYIFFNPQTGSHIRHIKEAFWGACKKAKIENLTIHDLRHTAASFLVNDCGIDIVTASKILGHSKIDMTMKYIHPSDEHKQKGIDKLGELFKIARHKVDSTVKIRVPVKEGLPLEISH